MRAHRLERGGRLMSKRVMRSLLGALGALCLSACGGDSDTSAELEVMDLDPGSAGPSVVVESITADSQGRLYVADRVSGALWQVDPSTGTKNVVAIIAPRQIGDGDPVKPD